MSTTVTGKIGITITNNAGVQVISASLPYTGNNENLFQEILAIGTDVEYDIEFLVAKSTLLAIISTTNATVKVDSTGSPTPTITLLAGVPKVFPIGTNPFTTDVTKIFVTNAAITTLTIYRVDQL